MLVLSSYTMLLLVFVVCSSFTSVNSALPKDDAKRLVLQEQVGDSLYAAYRWLLLNPLSATEGTTSPISQQCLADLKNIGNNSKKLFTCKSFYRFYRLLYFVIFFSKLQLRLYLVLTKCAFS